MAQHRSVRFMPMQDAQPPPVFSPTQVGTKTSVLHSVFSPTIKQQQHGRRDPSDSDLATDAAFRSQLSKSIDQGYSLEPPPAPPPPPPPPPPRRTDNLPSSHPSDRKVSPQVEANSRAFTAQPGAVAPPVIATARSPSPRRPGGIRHVGGTAPSVDVISPLSTTTSDVFFSPKSSHADLTSPTSVQSSASFKSLRDVTLLDVDNINKCVSVDDLENVIQVLDGEGRFQALLRKARSRLAAVLLGEATTINGKGPAQHRFTDSKPYCVPLTKPFFPPHKKESTHNRDDATSRLTSIAPSATRPFFQPNEVVAVVKPPPPLNQLPGPSKKLAIPPTFRNFSPTEATKAAAATTTTATTNSPPKFSNFSRTEAPSKSTAAVAATTTIASVNHHYAIQLEPATNSPSQDFAPLLGAARAGVLPERDAALNETNESSLIFSLSSLDVNFDDQTEPVPVSNRNTRRLSGRQSPGSGCHDKSLSEELKRLTETVLTMENARASDRKLFLDKLTSLEDKRNGTGDHFKTVESMMEQSTASTRELLDSLRQLRTESRELQDNVKEERNSWNQTYKEAQQLENRLCQKAQELTEIITSVPQHAAQADAAKAEAVRKQYEAEIAEKGKENEKLAKNLRETLESLLVSLGRSKYELQDMTRGEQKTMVTSFAKKQLSSNAAMEAMAQEVALLEKERRDASRATEAVSSQLEKSKSAQLQLERENKQLSQKIQELSEELKKMRDYMKELSSDGRSQEAWAEQDKRYQEIIRTLKSQLRKEETMVSVGLYKAAVDSARVKSTEIEQKSTELYTLKQKFSTLELQLEDKARAHNNTLLMAGKKAAEREGTKQRLAELESELQRERQTSQEAAAVATQESEKHKSTLKTLNTLREQVADLKWEMQENGSNFNGVIAIDKSPSPRRGGMQDVSSQPTRVSPPMTPKAMTSVVNNENTFISPFTPFTGTKPLRDKFSISKRSGGIKGLRQRVQQRRSPRAQPTVIM